MIAPKFLRMPAVGIDISDRSIKYAEIISRGTTARLGRFGEIPLAQGIVESGRIVTPEKLIEVLAQLKKEQHVSFVRATLPEEQVYFFRTFLNEAPLETLRSTIELSLEEHVPIPPEEVAFDFDIIATTNGRVEVAVTASHKAVVESYADCFAKAGLTLLSLELEAEALVRTVTRPQDLFAQLIVDFGETRTGIVVSYGGEVYFTSSVTIGGRMLTETLAKHFGISVEEAEKMKREFGLLRNGPNQDLFSLLLNNVAVLRDEINKHFMYWHTHPDESGKPRPSIEELILVGGDSNLSGLAGYFAASLHVRTVIGDVWTNVELPSSGVPELARAESLGFATVIGLSL